MINDRAFATASVCASAALVLFFIFCRSLWVMSANCFVWARARLASIHINDWNTAFNAYLMQRITTLSILSAFSVWLCAVRLLSIHSTSLADWFFLFSLCVCVMMMLIYNPHKIFVIDFVVFFFSHRRHRVRAQKVIPLISVLHVSRIVRRETQTRIRIHDLFYMHTHSSARARGTVTVQRTTRYAMPNMISKFLNWFLFMNYNHKIMKTSIKSIIIMWSFPMP